MLGRYEDQTVPPVTRLAPVVADVVNHGVKSRSCLVARVPLIRGEEDEAQATVIRYVCVRCEDMDAVEQRRPAREPLKHIEQLDADITRIFEPLLAILHLTAQVGARVEPEPRCIQGLVARAIQVVQPISESVEGVRVGRGNLARLQAPEQHPPSVEATNTRLRADRRRGAAEKERAGHPPRRVHGTEPWLTVLKLSGLGPLAVNV